MIGFIIGLLAGGFLGVFVMALLNAASREDEQWKRYYSDGEL